VRAGEPGEASEEPAPTRSDAVSSWPDEAALGAAMAASSPLAFIAVDEDRLVRSFNPAAERLVGRPAAEIVGSHVGQLFPPETRAGALDAIEAAGRGEEGHLELVVSSPPWEHRTLVGMSWGPLAAEGRTVGLVGVGRDITRRKELEHDLEVMAGSFRALAEASDLGMYRFSFSPQLSVDYLNPVLEQRLGFTTAQLRDDPSPLWNRLPREAVEQLTMLRRGERPAAAPIEASWQHPAGDEVRIQIREVALCDVAGRVTGALGVVNDVTAQRLQQETLAETLRMEREAADALRRVDELRRLFLQAVSHELRTPLTTVLGFSATLQARAPTLDWEETAGIAGRIHRQGQRIERLLDDLLDIERLSRGVVTIERHELDLAGLVTEVTREHGGPGIEVQAPPTRARLDAAKVERIVVNLLANARRHAGPDAVVRVSVGSSDGSVRIVVEDDGPGLADELKRRVFEPFEQGPNSSNLASPGTGIGLALVAAFAELHGGSAWAEDSELGGARFVVELSSS
jgi:PAS domain S-box-containing protein